MPLAIGQGLLLLARRRAPTAVLAAVTPLGVFMLAVGYPSLAASAGMYCAAYAVAFYGRGGEGAELARTLQGAAAVLIAAFALAVGAAAPGARQQGGAWGWFTVGALVAACWVLGYALRTRRDYVATRHAYVAELRDRAARLEAQEGERAARAVVDERLRIARELHDVIGHSISLIAIQSEAAARSARSNPDAVPAFLSGISAARAGARGDARRAGRAAPGRRGGVEPAARARAGGRARREPARGRPGDAARGGADAAAVRDGTGGLPDCAGVADQRPQARRGRRKAGVTIIRSRGTVRVSVHDDGAGPSGRGSSTAHGIVGMRERVAAYGGTLRTGARPGGGFEVEASIPLPEQEAP